MTALCYDQLSAVVGYPASMVVFEGTVVFEGVAVFEGVVLVASGELVYWICLLQETHLQE